MNLGHREMIELLQPASHGFTIELFGDRNCLLREPKRPQRCPKAAREKVCRIQARPPWASASASRRRPG